MIENEDRVDKLEEKYSNLHTVVNVLAAKVDSIIEELRDFKQEMRQQNEMRAAEIREMRQKNDETVREMRQRNDEIVQEMRQRNEETVREMRQRNDELNNKIDEKFEKILSQLQNMAIATVVGVGAIVWAVVSSFK